MAESVLFSYDPRLPTDRDWLRFLVGDTSSHAPALGDDEYDALLADEPDPEPHVYGAEPTLAQWRAWRCRVAAQAADLIAAKHARDVDRSMNGQSVQLSVRAKQYYALAVKLRDQARMGGGGWVRTERW